MITMRAKARGCDLLFLFCTLRVLFLSAGAQATETPTSSGWHVKDAPIRFRIEKDDNRSLIPEVSLLDLPPDKKSESV